MPGHERLKQRLASVNPSIHFKGDLWDANALFPTRLAVIFVRGPTTQPPQPTSQERSHKLRLYSPSPKTGHIVCFIQVFRDLEWRSGEGRWSTQRPHRFLIIRCQAPIRSTSQHSRLRSSTHRTWTCKLWLKTAVDTLHGASVLSTMRTKLFLRFLISTPDAAHFLLTNFESGLYEVTGNFGRKRQRVFFFPASMTHGMGKLSNEVYTKRITW